MSRARAVTSAAASIQRQHPRDVRGGDLAERVPGHQVRPHPERLQQRGQRRPRPRTAPAGRSSVSSSAPSSLPHSTSRSGRCRCASQAATRRRTPRRTPGTTRTAARPCPSALRALPGEHEHRLARRGRGRLATPARPSRQGGQTGRARRRSVPSDDGPVLEQRAAGQRAGHVDGGRRPAVGEPARRRRPGPASVLPVAPTAPTAPPARTPRLRLLGDRRLLEDHVRVGAADAERGHRRRGAGGRSPATARFGAAAGPGPPTSRLAGRARRRAGSRGSTPCRSASTILITPADAGGGLGVADVGLHRAEPQRLARGPGRRWPAAPAPRSGRPAACRCRAPRPASTSAAARPRRRPARCGSPAAAPGRWARSGRWTRRPEFTADAAHHGQHPVAVAARVGQPLQHAARRRPRPRRSRRRRRRTPCTARRATSPRWRGELDEHRRAWP